ncbi:uncharacterized protein [Procambarus clarkii]|uniref:uncharacterized protein n=1 Tax=Procambarus clarkii TaxID=6728 RepID=UPI0037433DCC
MDQELEMSSEFIEISFSAHSTPAVDVSASAVTNQDTVNHGDLDMSVNVDLDMSVNVDLDMSVNFEGNTQSTGSSNSVDVFGMNVSRDIVGRTYNETTVCENKFLPVNCVVSLTVDASGVSPVDSSGSQASFPALTQRGEGPLTVSNSRVSRGHPAAQFPQRQQQQAIDQQSDKLNKFEDKPVELQYIKHIHKEEHPPTPQNIHKLGLQNNEKPGEYISSRHSNPNVPKTQSSSSVNTSDTSRAPKLSKDTRLSHINPYFKVTCTLCGILYSHKRYLTRHMSAHGANKKYPCSLCTCSFTQTGNLRRHIDGHKANNIMAQRQELPSISGNSGDTSLAFQLSKDTLKSRFNPNVISRSEGGSEYRAVLETGHYQ